MNVCWRKSVFDNVHVLEEERIDYVRVLEEECIEYVRVLEEERIDNVRASMVKRIWLHTFFGSEKPYLWRNFPEWYFYVNVKEFIVYFTCS